MNKMLNRQGCHNSDEPVTVVPDTNYRTDTNFIAPLRSVANVGA